MKKKLFYIASVCAALAVQTACSPQFEDLFDKSASERLQEAMDDAETVLTAADKGWSMGYFPTTSARGYVLFAKFNADGTVTLTDYNNGGLSSTSTYSMNTSQGPVLNFDTYSEVLGHYVDPGTWQGGSTGNSGDFEFVIFNVTEDEVILKGKKYHAKVVLRKITGDGAQETLWRAYYDQCEAMYGKLFASGVSPVLKVGDDMIYRFDNAVSRAFEMYPYGSNNPEEMIPLSYVASTVGIDLAEELEVNGKSVRSFVYDETAMLLISREDASVQIVGPEVYGYFLELASPYLASEENMKGSFSVAFQALVSDFQNAYEGRQQLKKIGFSIMTDGRFAFTLKMANATACYALPARVENGLLVLEAFDYDNATENMDDNATIYYNKVASIKDMLNLLPGTYRLENKSGMHMNVIELLSEDSANSMLLERE